MSKIKSKAAKKRQKNIRRILFLGIGSVIIIVATTFTIGHYWVEIYDKYKEKKALEEAKTRGYWNFPFTN